jgi:hypothetical protein
MRRVVLICLAGLLVTPTVASARAKKKRLGKLKLDAWDTRKEVFFQTVEVWKKGCYLHYRYAVRRVRDYPLKLRVHLTFERRKAQVSTPWTESQQAGVQRQAGRLKTRGCWVKRARRLKAATFEVLGDPPQSVPKGGFAPLGKVTFNRWGKSGDVYYRHIEAWKKGCRIHYHFLYKRRTGKRRRLRLKLTFDNGVLNTTWVRSKKRGWREIVGALPTPDCWAKQTKTLRTAGFESERY